MDGSTENAATTPTPPEERPQRPAEQISTGGKLVEWAVERDEFWERTGRKVAIRNLLISIPCLLCAFAVWLYWSIIIVQKGAEIPC